MENANTEEYLLKVRNSVISNIRATGGPPSVQLTDAPRQPLMNGMDSDAEDEAADLDADQNPDVRNTQFRSDQNVTRTDEFEESDDEEVEPNGRRRSPLRRRIGDFPNPYAAELHPEDGDVVMSGANGRPGDDEDVPKDTENAEMDEDSASDRESTPAPQRVSRPQLWDTAAEAAPPVDDDDEDADEMDMDDDDDAEDNGPDSRAGGYEQQGEASEEGDDEADEGGALGNRRTPARSPSQTGSQAVAVTSTEDVPEESGDVEMDEDDDAAPARTTETRSKTRSKSPPHTAAMFAGRGSDSGGEM
jgi:histone deacetylase 1/2